MYCTRLAFSHNYVWFLSSQESNQLREQFSGDRGCLAVYLYCDYKAAAQQTPAHLLRSLLQQFVHHRGFVSTGVSSLYRCRSSAGTRVDFSKLYVALQEEAKQFRKLFIVLESADGMDGDFRDQ